MTEAPDERTAQNYDGEIYVDGGEFAFRFFDSAEFSREDIERAERDGADEFLDDIIGRVTDRFWPYYFEDGDVVGYAGFDTKVRGGMTMRRSNDSPGIELLRERTGDGEFNLTVTPADGWTATAPWLAGSLEPGDLLEAVTNGQVAEIKGRNVVFGWPEGRYYMLRPQGPDRLAPVYRYDMDRGEPAPNMDGEIAPVFRTNAAAVYKEPDSDPIIGYKQDTDTGEWSWDPYFVSDLPDGYELDPYLPGRDDLKEIEGETIYVRADGVIYETDRTTVLGDKAVMRIEYVPSLSYKYAPPTSQKSADNEIEIVAIPAEDPEDDDTSGVEPAVSESPDTDTGEEAEQEGMSQSDIADELRDLYGQAPFSRDDALDALRDVEFPLDLDEYDGIGPSRMETLQRGGIPTAADLGMLVIGTGPDDALPTAQSTIEPLTTILQDFQGSGKADVINAGATVREAVLEGLAANVGGAVPTSLEIGGAGEVPSGDLDTTGTDSQFPVTVTAVLTIPDGGRAVVDGEISLSGGDVSVVDGDTLTAVQETLELVYRSPDISDGQEVAEVTFTSQTEYEIEQLVSPVQTNDIEVWDREMGFDTQPDVPRGEPEVVVRGPDGTRYEVLKDRVYAYPASVDADEEWRRVPRQSAERLGVPATTLFEKIEQGDGWEILKDERPPEVEDDPSSSSGGGGSSASSTTDDTDDEPSPLPGGVDPSVLASELDGLMPGADVTVDILGDDVRFSWEAESGMESNFGRTSGTMSGDVENAPDLVGPFVASYDAQAELSDQRADSVNQRRENSELDVPAYNVDTGTQDDEPQDDGSGFESVDQQLNELPEQERQALVAMRDAATNFNIEQDQREFDAADAIEPILLDRYGDIIEVLTPTKITYASNSVAAYTVRPLLTDEGRDRIAGLGLFENLPLFVPASKLPQLFDDMDEYIGNLDVERPGNEDTKTALREIENLTTRKLETARVDIEDLLMTPAQIQSFAKFNFLGEESAFGIWFGRVIYRIFERSRALGAAQAVFQKIQGDGRAEEWIDNELRNRTSFRFGSNQWYLDIADRLAAQGDFDPVEFVQRWHNAHERVDSKRGGQELGPDNKPPKLDAYAESPDPTDDPPEPGSREPEPSGPSPTPPDPSRPEAKPEPEPEPSPEPSPDPGGQRNQPPQQEAGGLPDGLYDVAVLDTPDGFELAVRPPDEDDYQTDDTTDPDLRSIIRELDREVATAAATQSVEVGQASVQGGQLVETELVSPINGTPLDFDGGERQTSDADPRGSVDRGRSTDTSSSRERRSPVGGGDTTIEEFNADRVLIEEVEVGPVDVDTVNLDTVDQDAVDSIREGIEGDIRDDG